MDQNIYMDLQNYLIVKMNLNINNKTTLNGLLTRKIMIILII